jgi:hypothetical protein
VDFMGLKERRVEVGGSEASVKTVASRLKRGCTVGRSARTGERLAGSAKGETHKSE